MRKYAVNLQKMFYFLSLFKKISTQVIDYLVELFG